MTEAPPRPRQRATGRSSLLTEPAFRPQRRRPALPADLDPRGPRGGVGRRPSTGGRFGRGLIVLLSAVVLVVSVGGWVSYNYFAGKVAHVTLHLNGKQPKAAGGGVENFLLVGTDSRAGADGAYGDAPGQRSDSTILAHLAKDGTTTMLSFPRDTLVTIPEYKDSSGTVHAAHRAKFNEAISDGGASLLVETVQQLTGIKIDHYVAVDLEGFKNIAGAIGGVNVCIKPSSHTEYVSEDGKVSTNTNDPMSGFLAGPGPSVHITGDQALAFVRQRHGLVNGDIGRIQRQQQFLGAVFRKALNIKNPLTLEKLIASSASALTLGSGTNLSDLKSLALRMHGLSTGKIHFETLPTHTPTPAEGGDADGNLGSLGAVQLYSQADLQRLVGPLRADPSASGSGSRKTPAKKAAPTPTLPPSRVTLSVFNGSYHSGAATTSTDALKQLGFQATSLGNASSHGFASSEVHYGAGEAAQAATVAAKVPGAKLVADSSVTGVQLIIGANYQGVGAAAATPPAASSSTSGGSGAASATPKPATQPVTAAPNCTY